LSKFKFLLPAIILIVLVALILTSSNASYLLHLAMANPLMGDGTGSGHGIVKPLMGDGTGSGHGIIRAFL